MNTFLKRLMNDEAGFIISMELVFILTIGVIGMVTGWSKLSASIAHELIDLSNAVGSLKQDYAFSGARHAEANKEMAYSLGSGYDDRRDACDCQSCCDIYTGTTGVAGHEDDPTGSP